MTKPNPYQICPSCQNSFLKPYKRAKFCSVTCQVTPRTIINENTGCIEWQGATNNHGYGQIRKNGAIFYVHRVMFENAHGRSIIKDAHLMHSCDNPKCCNPAHLSEGSAKDNLNDMQRKGRKVSIVQAGANHYRAKLTDEQVHEIRSLQGHVGSTILGRRFGVAPSTINRIWNGQNWARPSGAYVHKCH